jgi:osmotically-inducible protein OsmY
MRYLILSVMCILTPLLHGCLPVIATGAGAAVAASEDRRTLGTITEDQGIEFKTSNRVGEKVKDAHLNVTAYNRVVLLTGEAPNEAVRAEIDRIARAVENVRGVHNEIVIAGNSSLTSRTNDTLITTKVKTRFVESKKINSLQIKVVTEAGTVYLLGLVKRSEGESAAEVARTTSGVRKVVKLFEYLD